jgi:hypothetical protein
MRDFTEAKDLLNNSTEIFNEIRLNYIESARLNKINIKLRIKIKHFFEDIRSSLDYTANLVFEKYCNQGISKKIYFPYIKRGENRNEFSKRIDAVFPNLKNNNSKIYNYIIECQFDETGVENNWLIDFMKMNNESKHNNFLEFERMNSRILVFSNSKSGKVLFTIGPQLETDIEENFSEKNQNLILPNGTIFKGMLTVGRGISITIENGGKIILEDGISIETPQTFNAYNPPVFTYTEETRANEAAIENIIISFGHNKAEVLGFCEKVRSSVQNIVDTISGFYI